MTPAFNFKIKTTEEEEKSEPEDSNLRKQDKKISAFDDLKPTNSLRESLEDVDPFQLAKIDSIPKTNYYEEAKKALMQMQLTPGAS